MFHLSRVHVYSPAFGFVRQAREFFVVRYVLSRGHYLIALTQSVRRREAIIHRQKKAGVRGKRTENWIGLNIAPDAHIAYDITRSLRCLEGNGVQPQFISTVSKLAPGFFITGLVGESAQVKTFL